MLRKRMWKVKDRTQRRVVTSFLFVVLVKYESDGDGQRVWERVELVVYHQNSKNSYQMLLIAIYQYMGQGIQEFVEDIL